MDTTTSSTTPVDFAQIDDPQARRAMRQIYDELSGTVKRQQFEIEVLLEILINRHLTSISEFKQLMTRLQSAGPRHGRVHEAVASMNAPPTTASVTPHVV